MLSKGKNILNVCYSFFSTLKITLGKSIIYNSEILNFCRLFYSNKFKNYRTFPHAEKIKGLSLVFFSPYVHVLSNHLVSYIQGEIKQFGLRKNLGFKLNDKTPHRKKHMSLEDRHRAQISFSFRTGAQLLS